MAGPDSGETGGRSPAAAASLDQRQRQHQVRPGPGSQHRAKRRGLPTATGEFVADAIVWAIWHPRPLPAGAARRPASLTSDRDRRHRQAAPDRKSFLTAKSDLHARPLYHRKRDSIAAHLTIEFAALAVSRWIESTTGWSIRKFVSGWALRSLGSIIAKRSTGRPCLRSFRHSFKMNVSDRRGTRLPSTTIRCASHVGLASSRFSRLDCPRRLRGPREAAGSQPASSEYSDRPGAASLEPDSQPSAFEGRHHRGVGTQGSLDRKSTRLNSSHVEISYAVFCLKKK